MNIEWRPFLNTWEVSNTGLVRNKSRGNLLSIRLRLDGYLDVKLNYKRFLVHRLVALLFIDNPNNLPQVNHKDGQRSNANADNLEWVDQFANMRHAVKTGLFPDRKGVENGRATLNESDVRKIRNLLNSGKTGSMIARELGTTDSIVSNIKNRKTWKHVS